jgi:hypothetical protein
MSMPKVIFSYATGAVNRLTYSAECSNSSRHFAHFPKSAPLLSASRIGFLRRKNSAQRSQGLQAPLRENQTTDHGPRTGSTRPLPVFEAKSVRPTSNWTAHTIVGADSKVVDE